MRQELLTSCLGSTTSTRGSLMATSLIQDMSKPYTFSHPERRGRDLKHSTATPAAFLNNVQKTQLTVDLIVLVLTVLDSGDVQRGSVRENQSIRFLKQKHIKCVQQHHLQFTHRKSALFRL